VGTVPTARMMDFLSLATEPGVPPHALRLKPGCICSIMRNLSVDDGLVKNARVIITRLNQFTVEVKTLPSAANDFTSQVFCLPRINFEFQPSYYPWTVQRRQFPLRLAYATTFNSCQGLTLDRTVFDLHTLVFTHGQLYTALSRVRSRYDIRCFSPDDQLPISVKNIIYQNLLIEN